MKRGKPTAALFVNHPECSVQCASGIYEALHNDFTTIIFDRSKLKESYLKKFDMVIFPGGVGDSETFHKYIGSEADIIRNFVGKGKRYLGICMGAYWAGHHYFDIVNNIDIVQYIRRPNADIKRSFGTLAKITWNNEPMQMYFYDGAAMIGKNFTTIATYKNKDPMAVIQNHIGLIGCHPESMKSWYTRNTMKLYWHEYYHHKLLSNFTKLLFQD
jgi:GMP synthase-like glutamine amidotransferase